MIDWRHIGHAPLALGIQPSQQQKWPHGMNTCDRLPTAGNTDEGVGVGVRVIRIRVVVGVGVGLRNGACRPARAHACTYMHIYAHTCTCMRMRMHTHHAHYAQHAHHAYHAHYAHHTHHAHRAHAGLCPRAIPRVRHVHALGVDADDTERICIEGDSLRYTESGGDGQGGHRERGGQENGCGGR